MRGMVGGSTQFVKIEPQETDREKYLREKRHKERVYWIVRNEKQDAKRHRHNARILQHCRSVMAKPVGG